MPKRMFWPMATLILGGIIIATRLGLLSEDFASLWPIVLIVVGLAGIVISDKEEWDVESAASSKKPAKRKAASKTKKTARRKK
jgi:hypothetical protein